MARTQPSPIAVSGLNKSFTLHTQGGAVIAVIADAQFSVDAGECVALTGVSGAGKSTVMRMIYGNYRADPGCIRVMGTDIGTAAPRQIIALRRDTLGHVSQFLRVLPRVPAVEVVAEPLLQQGADRDAALDKARQMLARVNLPPRLWDLSPTTFSGGEQQRVNVARGFIHPYPVLLLDEPTASLDGDNRAVVLALIKAAKARGCAILGIFHDAQARGEVCDRSIDMGRFVPTGAPA